MLCYAHWTTYITIYYIVLYVTPFNSFQLLSRPFVQGEDEGDAAASGQSPSKQGQYTVKEALELQKALKAL